MPGLSPSSAATLKELYAFRTFSDAEMAKVAEVAEILELTQGMQIVVPAGPDAPFYMVTAGRVNVAEDRGKGSGLTNQAPYKAGQFFGADWLLYNTNRRLIATTDNPAKILQISAAGLKELLLTIPDFRDGLLFASQMQKWLRDEVFSWIGEDELVYLIARKHPIFLLIRLIQPGLGILAAFLLLGLSLWTSISSVQVVLEWSALAAFAAAFLWAIWRYIDWGNDYYVVTDQRIAWIEQVLGFYDSRREAFLSSIRNKQTATSNWFERRFGYGDIIITVYAGQIVFKNVPDPGEVSRLIDLLMRRAQTKVKKQNVQETQKLILQKIQDVNKIMSEEIEPLPPIPAPKPKTTRPSLPSWQEIQAFFRIETRFQQGDTITYRTHRIFLFVKLLLPTMTQLTTLFLAAISIQGNLQGQTQYPSITTTLLLAITLSIFSALWALYHFSDWRNDIYQITPDRILDKDHKPFQSETVVQAFISDILSMEIERENPFEMMFNYGTVIINSGTDQKLTFDNIPNPTHALQDIYNRLFQLRRSQELSEMRKQADQSALLLATYHIYEENRRRGNSSESRSASKTGEN